MIATTRAMAMALLLAGMALLTGCAINAGGASQSFDARKYWDRCLGTQCPPMETDARKG
jgi:hypothetical protein